MPVGDIYRVAIEGDTRGGLNVNVVHYAVLLTNGDVNAEMEALARGILADVIPAYQAITTAQTSFTVIKVRGVTTPDVGYDLPSTLDGTIVGENLPNQVAPEMMLRTTLLGPTHRGKIFLFPPAEADVSYGDLDADYFTRAAALFGELLQVSYTLSGTVYTFDLQVYSRKLAQSFGVVSHQVPLAPRTQRRRRIGAGA